jgi:alkylation response protein AidB-like acyl-CoA dehydrogenase
MYDLHLSAEQLEIRDTVRDFVNTVVKPITLKPARLEARDRILPPDLLDQASQMGLRTLALSEDHGGAGADALTACIVAEELAAGDVDLAAVLTETSMLGNVLFDRMMSAAQRERFLDAFVSDDRYHLAYAHQEPEGGDALGINYHRPVAVEPAIKTTAVRAANGDFIVNGVKHCVANAPLAKLMAVLVHADAKHPDGSVILIPHDTAGVSVREDGPERWSHGVCGEVTFKDCHVPADHLLAGDGNPLAAQVSGGRGVPLAQALNIGIGRAAFEAALDYAQLRVQGGRYIIQHQAIGTKLADIAVRLELARSAVWQAAWASDHPQAQGDRSLSDLPLQIVAQAYTAEAMVHVAKDAAECFGAMGVMRDMPLQKYVREARISQHSAGGAVDARLRLAEALSGYRRPAAAFASAAE